MSDTNAKVIDEFRSNGGRVGGPFEGTPLLEPRRKVLDPERCGTCR
jgi:hypothetical protein